MLNASSHPTAPVESFTLTNLARCGMALFPKNIYIFTTGKKFVHLREPHILL